MLLISFPTEFGTCPFSKVQFLHWGNLQSSCGLFLLCSWGTCSNLVCFLKTHFLPSLRFLFSCRDIASIRKCHLRKDWRSISGLYFCRTSEKRVKNLEQQAVLFATLKDFLSNYSSVEFFSKYLWCPRIEKGCPWKIIHYILKVEGANGLEIQQVHVVG